MKRTGRRRYRTGMFGKLILQVEWIYYNPQLGDDVRVWRDATLGDLTEHDEVAL
jgi:hypothetical protein